jgi:hypothetical protein
MEKAMLVLRQDVTPTVRDGVPGLTRGGRTRLARDDTQAALLQALAGGGQSLEHLVRTLTASGASPLDQADAALALAAFILDFEEYLEP